MMIKMNLNSYEAKVLGKEMYLLIAKIHNMTTGKHTYARRKAFEKDIKNMVQIQLRINESKKKRKED